GRIVINRQTTKYPMRSIHIKALLCGLVLAGLGSHLALAQTTLVFDYSKVWRYQQGGTNLPATWTTPAYNDSAWLSGPGPLGFPPDENLLGVATVQTSLNVSNPAGTAQIITYYFRTQFNFTGDPLGVTLMTSNLVDDGMVVYLNGGELFRRAMAVGAVNY